MEAKQKNVQPAMDKRLTKKLKLQCDGVHQFCREMSDCPYCVFEYPFRDVDTGRFVSYKEVERIING